MTPKTILPCAILLAVAGLSGCAQQPSAVDALPLQADSYTTELADVKDALSAASPDLRMPEQPVEFTGRGMSQVSTQPGGSLNQKRLMAIRAARMEALRDLTEQIHGIQITAESTMRDKIMRSDQVRGTVAGEIRGAQTLAITPKGSDGYEVSMVLRPDTVRYIVRAARQGG